MSTFTVAQFSDGDVIADGWWTPRPGQHVYLRPAATRSGTGLLVTTEPDPDSVSYTWPSRPAQMAGHLAHQHYRRCTGHYAGGSEEPTP